jgi:hypothetical protein
MAKLFLQILGNSDVVVDSQPGIEQLRGYSLEEVQEYAEINDEELINDIERIDFPLLQAVYEKHQDSEIYFGILLTDQKPWLEKQNMSPDAWNDFIASDGIWWKNLLSAWCQQKEIPFYPIHLEIPSHIPEGVADWEGIATLIKETLRDFIQFQGDSMQFLPNRQTPLPIDEIIIQHSSGTPATSSALYLWGIEQKLAEKKVKFIYFSPRDTNDHSHYGDEWQWRFKIPQIKQLFTIQDFAGALELLSDYPNNQFKKDVRYLDRATSFNLAELPDIDRSPKGKVLERIAIALWSEKAFRERGQWMHWYLRVAGAFELAILCLAEKQGRDRFQWQDDENNKTKSELIDTTNQNVIFRLSIYKTVTQLLETGSGEDKIKNQVIKYRVTPVNTDQDWNNFRNFYTGTDWQLSQNFRTSFLGIRNELYHALQGDKIDNILDKKTEVLASTFHPEHPAEIAVQYLHDVVKLAGIDESIQKRITNYQTRVENLKEQLEWIYKPSSINNGNSTQLS